MVCIDVLVGILLLSCTSGLCCQHERNLMYKRVFDVSRNPLKLHVVKRPLLPLQKFARLQDVSSCYRQANWTMVPYGDPRNIISFFKQPNTYHTK